MSTLAGALGRGLAGYAANRERSDQRDRDIEQQQRAEARQAMLDERQRVQMEAQAQAMKEQRERQAMMDDRMREQDRNEALDRGLRDTEPTRQMGTLMSGAAELGSGMGGPMGASLGALRSAGNVNTEAASGPQYRVGGKSMSRSALSRAQQTANAQAQQRRGERMADNEFTMQRDVQNNEQTIARDKQNQAFQMRRDANNNAAQLAAVTARAAAQPPRAALPTEGERKAAALYSVAQQGGETLEKLLVQPGADGKPVMRGAPSWMDRAKQKVGMDVGNVVTSDQQRQVTQAGLQLSDMWLRYTSGAAVPETEVARFAQTFTPLPGDDPKTLSQKMEARGRILSALKGAAGRALVVPPDAGTEPDMNDAGFREFLRLRREDEL
jgi:hypothetical protein